MNGQVASYERFKTRESFHGAFEPLIKKLTDERLVKWKEESINFDVIKNHYLLDTNYLTETGKH